ncbi:polysaccharide deacetylase family protein [Bowmanella yangjiangensis]|uniref:Polysaccharide deacetylase family protein n=1 Tax=Bowmanella yangjiangensis TaxID=2811230 RepID=A0ABS3CX99_9ALTE|nr:polysaccharide deacetylase family protein [Bowmanella yangjiangensis]MBN7821735.1 polysaccharide deacetylase family protein [Bowmanella yangjiangensis]
MSKWIIATGITLSVLSQSGIAKDFTWPDGQQAAVSLGYDDALASQLDIAIPQLNKHGLRGTFYLTLSSPVLVERMDAWRAAALSGHELANHSINHPCRADLPGREWVEAENQLDNWSMTRMLREVSQASSFLYAIDGQTVRTYTPPCGDRQTKDGDYVSAIEPKFAAIRLPGAPLVSMDELNLSHTPTWFPDQPSLDALIAYVEQAAKRGTLASISFHGVGGDHMRVNADVHDAFLAYLAKHPKRFWVSTFRDIAQYIHHQQSGAGLRGKK